MQKKTGKDALLWWCQEMTRGYAGVQVQNFHTSWGDGLAFCAIIHRFHSDLIPFQSLSKDTPAKNLELAFKVAESLGIPALLDVDDMLIPKPEQFSVMTYLSQYYHHFQGKVQGNPGLGLATITTTGTTTTSAPTPGIGSTKSTVSAASSSTTQSSASPPLSQLSPPPTTTTTSSSSSSQQQQSSTTKGLLPSRSTPALRSPARPVCPKCGKTLSGPTVEALGGEYHESCGKLLESFVKVDGKPYCEPCSTRAPKVARTDNVTISGKGPQQLTADMEAKKQMDIENKRKADAEKREKEEKEREERERAEKQRMQAQREREEREQLEKIARNKAQREAQERERLEREKQEKERQDREIMERERLERERLERERSETDKRQEAALMRKQQSMREEQERKAELQKQQKFEELKRNREERERQKREKAAERERIEKMRLEQERLEREKAAERVRLQREAEERERLERERLEREKQERERQERERIERERLETLERERLERLERERVEKEKSEVERQKQRDEWMQQELLENKEKGQQLNLQHYRITKSQTEKLPTSYRMNPRYDQGVNEVEQRLQDMNLHKEDTREKDLAQKREELRRKRAEIEAKRVALEKEIKQEEQRALEEEAKREREREEMRRAEIERRAKSIQKALPKLPSSNNSSVPSPRSARKGENKAEEIRQAQLWAEEQAHKAEEERQQKSEQIMKKYSNAAATESLAAAAAAAATSQTKVGSATTTEKVLEGYLDKQDPGGFRVWRKRWFSLVKGEQIVYFETSDTTNPNNPVLGNIPLELIHHIHVEQHPTKYIFNLDTQERIYILRAPNAEVLNYWVNGLREAMTNLRNRRIPEAQKVTKQQMYDVTAKDLKPFEGWLTMQGGLLQLYAWSRYYFVVKMGFMVWSKAPGARAEGKIALYRCRFEDYYDPQRPFGMKIVTSSRDTYMIAAEDEESLAKWIQAICKQKIVIEEAIDQISV